MNQPVVLRSYEFRRAREGSWRELEALLELADKGGVKKLSAEQLGRLPILYRAALSSLSVARNISLDQNVVEYLEGLASRAYFVVYGTPQRLSSTLREFFLFQLPAAFRRARWAILLSTLAMVAGTAVAFTMVIADPDAFYTFVSPDYASGRDPATTTEDLRAILYDDGGGGTDALVAFASFLFTHNAKIGILAFAVGFLLGVPTALLMFVNGLTLGAFAALYHGRGLSVDLWGWLLPHGVTELGAVILCGAAGLTIASAVISPGQDSRRRSLARRGPEVAQLVVGAVLMLLIAGLIEGIFRQTVTSVPVRYAVAASSFALWVFYFGFVGRSREQRTPA